MQNNIFSIKSKSEFETLCFETFLFQAKHCAPYAEWIKLLDININNVNSIEQIPFLPIELFKTKRIFCGVENEEIIFSSSSTTDTGQSFHYVADLNLYEKSFTNAFRFFYENPNEYAFLGLLPSYLEREGSSLVYMVDNFIRQSKQNESGFFLYDFDKLYSTLCELKQNNIPTVLIGVTYALLDFAEKYSIDFPNLIVMETGGMKGKRKELTRSELHKILRDGFGVKHIHSEYGMAELLSQAYSKGDGVFYCPPWMKILTRDVYNPFKILDSNQSGGINIIDLANRNSCSFIATQDLGIVRPDCGFEILGRFSESDIRGCNLLVQ